jgi:hypothetical protein
MMQKTNQEIYKSLSKSIATAGGGRRSVGYRHLVQEGVMQLEFLPMLNRIISPPLRPVSYRTGYDIHLNLPHNVGQSPSDQKGRKVFSLPSSRYDGRS